MVMSAEEEFSRKNTRRLDTQRAIDLVIQINTEKSNYQYYLRNKLLKMSNFLISRIQRYRN